MLRLGLLFRSYADRERREHEGSHQRRGMVPEPARLCLRARTVSSPALDRVANDGQPSVGAALTDGLRAMDGAVRERPALPPRLLEREERRVAGEVDGRRLRRLVVPAGEARERLVLAAARPGRECGVPGLRGERAPDGAGG